MHRLKAASKGPNNYWDFGSGRHIRITFRPYPPYISSIDMPYTSFIQYTVTDTPVVGRAACPGSGGARTHNPASKRTCNGDCEYHEGQTQTS